MGQFKPMIKMQTTEPSVVLKLKKGGAVRSMVKMRHGNVSGHKKMANGGGAMGAMMGTPALVGRPALNAPVRSPGRPSLASRRRAMMPRGTMKKGGAPVSSKMEEKLHEHASKPASKAHKGLKTGGVALGNAGGFKKGGAVNTEMHTSKHDAKSGGQTKGVRHGNAGGYKTGGVTLGNGGGYRSGGNATKKYKDGKLVTDRDVSEAAAIDPSGKLAQQYRDLMKLRQDDITTVKGPGIIQRLLGQKPIQRRKPMTVEEAIAAQDAPPGMGSVTETEKSVTVTPPRKKRGGRAC